MAANVAEANVPGKGWRAQITEILGTTPATDPGLRPGDILLQVGKVKVNEPEDVLDASFFITAGDTVPITVIRGNEKLTFCIQAEFRAASKRQPLLAAPPTMTPAIPLKLDDVRP